jgi:hypothetical protein
MPLNNPHYRPQRSLYETVTSKWLTLTNFAWFLGILLAIVMAVLIAKSAKVLGVGGKEYPYELVALTGTQLDYNLRSARTMGSLVFMYDSNCKGCDKEMDSLLNLRSYEENNQISLYFISLDENPVDTMTYLEKQRVPESMVTYHVSPDTRNAVKTVLENHGTTPIKFEFPHTMLFSNSGQLIVEYKGYVRSQEIMRTLQLFKLQQTGQN